ncbi:MAG: coiled-coil protein [Thermoplasmata archaeon]
MNELLPNLEEKRDKANVEADRHRHRRDELNNRTKEWIEKRDTLNAQVRQFIDEAAKHRNERDALNEAVQSAKAERETWNRKVSELLDGLNRLRRRKTPKGAVPLDKLRRDLRGLEFRQQTSVLAVDKERDLIEQIARLRAEIKGREKALEEDEEVQALTATVKETKETAEHHHQEVTRLADDAQVHHDSMVNLYEQADTARREADKAQEQFIKTKMMADKEHQKHIEFIHEVHDYDKIIHGMRAKARRSREGEGEVTVKQEAELIYERFKKGEKLSTEDLMLLQKSGYL